ncbi:MAG: DUF6029 family protein [Fidelibacterota bacterium]
MNNRILYFIVCCITLSFLSAQVTVSGSANIRYGEDKTGFIYSEKFFDTQMQIGPLTTWFQWEFSNPPEVGLPHAGLRKFRFEYESDRTMIKYGDLYEFWGRGLVLNQFENQQIDIDNSVTGLFLSSHLKERWVLDIISGQGKLWYQDERVNNPPYDERRPNYRREHRVIGSRLHYQGDRFDMGATYLQSRERHPYPSGTPLGSEMDTLALKHRLNSLYANLYLPFMDVSLEYAETRTAEFIPDRVALFPRGRGQSFYGSVNAYLPLLTVFFDYKRYGFDSRIPDEGSPAYYYTGALGFQSPPIVIKEHTSQLLNRITHVTDIDNEVGYQVEISGPITSDLVANLNFSRASMINRWQQERLQPFGWEWKKNGSAIFWPVQDKSAKPFGEIYAEIEGYISDPVHVKMGAAYTEDIPEFIGYSITDTTRDLNYVTLKAHTYPLALDISFADHWNLEVKYERQILEKMRRSSVSILMPDTIQLIDNSFSLFENGGAQDGWILSLGIGRSPQWSLNILIDAISTREFGTYEDFQFENPMEKIFARFMEIENKWISLEFSVNLTERTRFQVAYGSLQGGIVCTNGICRFIEPFNDGFQLSLVSLF